MKPVDDNKEPSYWSILKRTISIRVKKHLFLYKQPLSVELMLKVPEPSEEPLVLSQKPFI